MSIDTSSPTVTSSAGALSRRTFVRAGVGASAALLSGAAGAPWAAASARGLKVYVLVIDGCRPGEITADNTPRLFALKTSGLRFPRARSMPVMETIPNHTMMMSGMRPDRTGVPANSIYERGEQVVRNLDRPSDLRVPTLLDRLPGHGHPTGSVLSKEYLFGIFGTRATYRWEPEPIVPVSGHAPDFFTINALIAMVSEADPDLVFVNLGDIDRFGHADYTGTTVRAARRTALHDTDTQIGRFVDLLHDTGRWERSVVIVLADHSMDWSQPDNLVSLQPALDADPLLAGQVVIAQNGGADLLYWTGSAGQRDRAVRHIRRVVTGVEGVLAVHDPAYLRLGPLAGDLVAFCRAGWRFSDPRPVSNPIPGNHGHPATEPIPLWICGGHPSVERRISALFGHTTDVAPTVGRLFGLPEPRGGYDGRHLR